MERQIDIVEYFALGRHAFAAIDDEKHRDSVVARIESELESEPLQVVDGRHFADTQSFANEVAASCARLLSTIPADCAPQHNTLWAHLKNVETAFGANERQGFLIINHIDPVVESQSTIEIEGPFREVMQFHDDVAILWVGTRKTIQAIHQYERPFYLSHRVFWL